MTLVDNDLRHLFEQVKFWVVSGIKIVTLILKIQLTVLIFLHLLDDINIPVWCFHNAYKMLLQLWQIAHTLLVSSLEHGELCVCLLYTSDAADE